MAASFLRFKPGAGARAALHAQLAISLYRLRAVGVLSQVAHWIAISHAQKRIHIRFGIPGERITVLYHCYCGPLLSRAIRGRDVLFVGRLSPEKGVQILIEAWKKIEIRDRFLWIVGEGPLGGHLEDLARSCPNIRFAGLIRGEELSERWLNAAISVVPSIWEEPFGRVLTESWAHGVPVVAARIGALPELIEITGAGCLMPVQAQGWPISCNVFCRTNLPFRQSLRNATKQFRNFLKRIGWGESTLFSKG